MTYKALLRRSRPQAEAFFKAPIVPLINNSSIMHCFIERCIHKARYGDFLAITGHPGDLIEMPALFADIAQALGLGRLYLAPSGLERSTVLNAPDEKWNALLIPQAGQLPVGTQEWMVEGNLYHIPLIMLGYPANKNIDLSKTIRASLRKKCGEILQYPDWDSRKEDHAEGIVTATKLAEDQYGIKIRDEVDSMCPSQEKSWKSMAHMIAVVREIAMKKNRPRYIVEALRENEEG
jgi:hypothetical protein